MLPVRLQRSHAAADMYKQQMRRRSDCSDVYVPSSPIHEILFNVAPLGLRRYCNQYVNDAQLVLVYAGFLFCTEGATLKVYLHRMLRRCGAAPHGTAAQRIASDVNKPEP